LIFIYIISFSLLLSNLCEKISLILAVFGRFELTFQLSPACCHAARISLSDSGKRGCVVATAEKTEQRLLFSLFTMFSGVYSNFWCFARSLLKFSLILAVFPAVFC